MSEFWQGVIAGLAGLGWLLLIILVVTAFAFRKRGK